MPKKFVLFLFTTYFIIYCVCSRRVRAAARAAPLPCSPRSRLTVVFIYFFFHLAQSAFFINCYFYLVCTVSYICTQGSLKYRVISPLTEGPFVTSSLTIATHTGFLVMSPAVLLAYIVFIPFIFLL